MLKITLAFILIALIIGVTACGTTSSIAQSEPTATLVETAEPEPVVTEVMTEEAAANAARGQQIFTSGINGSPPCSTCHVQSGGESPTFQLAPSLVGFGERAATRVEGMGAEEYIHHSIVAPGDYVVSGFRAIMYGNYADHFSQQDIADLTAYLLTL